MTKVKRQGIIDALLFDDLRIIKKDLFENDDPNYLFFLFEHRDPYSKWSDAELEEAYLNLEGI